MTERDLLVVGGGPAGLITALDAARRGLRATVIERRRPPIDKACGEGLMPDGVAHLERLGVELPEGRPFRGISYLDGNLRIEGDFPGAPGLGIRRLRLHRALMDSALAAGVECRWGVRADGLDPASLGAGSSDSGSPDSEMARLETSEGPLHARLIVGADGLRSKIRTWAGLGAGSPGSDTLRRFGVRRHFGTAPWSDRVEVHWSDEAEAYVTPVGENEVGVAILWSGRKAGFDELLSTFPRLLRRLGGAEILSRDRGTGPLRQKVRSPLRGRVALVGDAAGYVDAITGEGLSLAFHHAEALLDAWEAEDLESYPRRLRAAVRVPEGLTHLLLAIEARPWLRRRVMAALAADPALFEGFLAVHVRSSQLSSLLPSLPRMVWRLATARG